ncbi:MAG TPA: M50 family metallopeptidase [Candidatus Baltobacteraceae bacterium]|jgi:regulator of sigma E protease|nr:M50 family metallopeptidase [Candidatus Baltobacteraceae bacterium]
MMLLIFPAIGGLVKILVFLGMLSVLVVLHEGGHFLVARRSGVHVDDFAVGFGPTLLKWTSPRSGTNYRLNVLPLGGYCAMQGEDGRTSEAEQQRAFRSEADEGHRDAGNFQSKSPLARLAIVFAGPVANLVLAFIILLAGGLLFGIVSDKVSTVIGPLRSGFPAEHAGLRLGDRIVAINGIPMTDGLKMIARIHAASTDAPLSISFERGGERRDLRITPRRIVIDGKSVSVLGFSPMSTYQHADFGTTLKVALGEYKEVFGGTVVGLSQLVLHPVRNANLVSGPIGMERAASQLQDLGWGPYFQFAAMISIALGIFNLLPIPALDGGRAIFILAELVRGRPLDPKKENLVHLTGFALLLVLMLFVAYHDVTNIISGKEVF